VSLAGSVLKDDATTAAILRTSHHESVTAPIGLTDACARARAGDQLAAKALHEAGHATGGVIGTNIAGVAVAAITHHLDLCSGQVA
jgi:predicted NBD/HSP70 family sugar kinase